MNNWKDINFAFTPQLQNQWESHGFSYLQTKEWIDIGLKPNDADYVAWLRDHGYNALWVLNHGQDELLRKDYENILVNAPVSKKNKPWWILLLAGLLVLLARFLLTN